MVTTRIGLCATCAHHREIVSDRGSRFHLCELAKSRRDFPRYPTLPVLRCRGYQPTSGSAPK